MTTLTTNRTARTFTLCALYCAQGMPWGFVTVTLLAYLADRGLSLDETADIVKLATLPWSFKVLWGLVIDRFTVRSMGRRRFWLLLSQLGIGVTLLCMILRGDVADDVRLLAWMVFTANVFVSLQDVACDALAVDVLHPDERGRVNGLMWGSNYLGVAIGGAGMGTVLARFGVEAAFGLQVGVLFVIALFPLLLRERPGEKLLPWTRGEADTSRDSASSGSVRRLTRALLGAFAAPAQLLGLVYAGCVSLMVGMMVTINPVFCTQEVGWTQEQYSQLEGGGGSLAGVVGALLGGFLVDRLGIRRLVTVASVLIAALCFTLGASDEARGSSEFIVFYVLAMGFLVSAQTVAGFSLFMGLCRVAVAGTMFTLYMAAANFARVGGAGVVDALSSRGYGTLFTVMGAAVLLSLPLLYAIPRASPGPAEAQAG